jgi:N-acetylneuraminate synthase
MYWGLKARFGDINEVMLMNPVSVEFHLTDNDVLHGKLNGRVYNCDYSIHLPEYWNSVLIDPCDINKMEDNLHIYNLCIDKGLSLRNNFKNPSIMKVILHPGGASIEEVENLEYISILYHRLAIFCERLNQEFSGKIELLVENMPPLPWFYGGQYYSNIFAKPDDIQYFCKNNDVNICLDISHLGLHCNNKKINIIDAIETLKPFIRQIHIADAKGTDGEGASIGDGNINFKQVIDTIKDIDSAVIPEVMWGHRNNYYEFKKTMTICNEYLGGNNG